MFQPKTLAQIKADMIERAGPQKHPMEGTQLEDVRRACNRLQSLDGDHWGKVWSEIAQPYAEAGEREERSGNRAEAERNYFLAYNYFRLGRFAVPNAPEKKAAHRASVENFVKASRYFDCPVETVSIPFAGRDGEGSEIPVYLRKPEGRVRPPVLISHGGVDSFKEEAASRASPYLARGMAVLAMDMPGTGQCPILGNQSPERLYDAVISYVQSRKDLDGSRIGLQGRSFGGYWATRIAHAEPTRLAAAVCWGGGAHYGFQVDWQPKCRYVPLHLGNDDLVVTRAHAFGIHNYEEWLRFVPSLSLLDMGVLDKPCAPLLVVNGKNDLNWPLEDIYILLEHGSPKTVRLFPGGHMGHTPQTIPTVVDWLAGRLNAK